MALLGSVSGSVASTGSFGKVTIGTTGFTGGNRDTDAKLDVLGGINIEGYKKINFDGNGYSIHGFIRLNSLNPGGGAVPMLYSFAYYGHRVQNQAGAIVDFGFKNTSTRTLFHGDVEVAGDLNVDGNITAQNYIVSSSVTNITYQSLSGSTIFGDSADDTHTFLGNTISGSATSTGSFGRISVDGISISDNDAGNNNTIFGRNAATSFSANNGTNIIVGPNAADAMDGGESHNIAIGNHSMGAADEGASGTIDFNLAIGNSTLGGGVLSGTAQLYGNIAIGYQALTSTGTNGSTGQTAIGFQALEKVTTGVGNFAIGYNAGKLLTTGQYNLAIGHEALTTATELDDNIAIGYRALKVASGSAGTGRNIAIGYLAGKAVTNGEFNVLIGRSAGDQQTTADANTFMGYFAGYNTRSGSENVFIGRQAGYEFRNANSPYNVYVGSFAGYHNRTGRYNTYLGGAAGYGASGQSHNNNVGVGTNALNDVTTGGDNVAIGSFVAAKLTTGVHNVFIGKTAADDMVEGSYNIAIGSDALGGAKDGTADSSQFNIFMGVNSGNGAWVTAVSQYNIGIGHYTLDGAMNGAINNTAVGHNGLSAITTGDSNVAIGYNSADAMTTGHNNVAIGLGAMGSSTNIGYAVAIGSEALNNANATDASDSSVAIGNKALYALLSGIGNVAVGGEALSAEDDGDFSTAIGHHALKVQTGTSGTVGNTAVGYKALDEILTGTANVAVGANALGNADGAENENVGIGYNAGINLDNGSNNIAIGSNTNFSTAAASNQVVIGKDATGVANNSVTLGNTSITNIYMSQDAGATVFANYLALGLGTTAPESGIEVRLDDSLGQLQLGDNSGNIYHRYFVSMSGAIGNGAAHHVPRGVPGTGTSNFFTHFKSAVGGGTTNHNVVIDGNVGIGQLSPGAKLDVTGTGRFTGELNTDGGIDSSGDLTLKSDGVTAVTIYDSGGVGLFRAHTRVLNGDGSVGSPSFTFNSDADTGIFRIGANNLGISTNGTQRIAVAATNTEFSTGIVSTKANGLISGSATSTGSFGAGYIDNKLGIGTTSPGFKLDVQDTGDSVIQTRTTTNSSGNDAYFRAALAGASAGDAYIQFDIDSVGGYALGIDNSDSDKFKLTYGGPATPSTANPLMTVTTAGLVGVGTANPSVALEVDGDISGSNVFLENGGGVYFRNSNGNRVRKVLSLSTNNEVILSGSVNEDMRIITGPNSAGEGIHFSTDGGTTTEVFINDGGNVGIGVGNSTPAAKLDVRGTISGSLIHSSGDVVAFNASDERLKDNIKLIKEPIKKIKQLRGVEYQWNEKQNTYPSGSLDSGIIAQDVQKVLPQLVKERGDGYLGVRQERLVGLLIESIKDQQDQIDDLRKQIKEMKDGSS